MIVEQATRLSTILDQILLASRIDTDNLDASSQVFDCREALGSVVEGIDPDLQRRVVVDAPAPVPIRADLDRLRQVIANLIDNALKYSTGTVRVTVAERDFSGRIAVSDDGPGIPEAERERIFEKFFRLDPAQRHGVGGTGLGLYIARELVERMDGRIGLLPRDGATEFFVDLPLGEPPRGRT
jgi:two-component system OmpR family sensor kinase